ncbi:MAG: BA14K family protein [Xanthobacteraceae bacterium]
MTFPSKILAAALMAGSLPIMAAGAAAAAPLSQSMALSNTQSSSTIEQVQWRRGGHWRGGHWRGGRWIGPAAGFAAGVAVGSALTAPNYYGDGYYAYGAAPGYGSGPVYRRGGADCGGTNGYNSANPSWVCQGSSGEAADFYQ